MSGWLLEGLEIEGFRGINNEGDPLVLRFGIDAVNSVSATNGVGKSSIFDALTFAIRGTLPKLEALPASERGSEYYVNRFHTQKKSRIALKLRHTSGTPSITIEVHRSSAVQRKVTGSPGIDPNAVLRELHRDFVLLDHNALRSFIETGPLERGRSFAGLLGLSRYSHLRQQLQSLSNTLAFNNHFNVGALTTELAGYSMELTRRRTAAASAFKALTGVELGAQAMGGATLAAAHTALQAIDLLSPHCKGKSFEEISIADCIEATRKAEGGEDRDRLQVLLKQKADWATALEDLPGQSEKERLGKLAAERQIELEKTAGTMLRDLYRAGKAVLDADSWTDKCLCPLCEVSSAPKSVQEAVAQRLAHYQKLDSINAQIEAEWSTAAWSKFVELERKVSQPTEPRSFASAASAAATGAVTPESLMRLWSWSESLVARAHEHLQKLEMEIKEIEARLPASLVSVISKLEAARRLQEEWEGIGRTEESRGKASRKKAIVERIKSFLDRACASFAAAESSASERRIAAVAPVFQSFFSAVMFDDVRPALRKPAAREELALVLSQFWTLKDVSAQALLSESFRNAFAVSVYLAAASLYGGAPKFVVLDDVTSSFDAGHQFQLMELIRTRFARPANATGPQVILLSHDTLLEKYFNKQVNARDWRHQRLQGTPQTAVLPVAGATSKLRASIDGFLTAGRVDEAGHRLREYLEYRLLEIIGKVQIPVPIDFAIDDNKKQVQNCLDAIDAAVTLHQQAGNLVLTAAQALGVQANVAAITGNFLSHFATGSTSTFSAGALKAVVKAIDDYEDCFKTEDPPGSGNKRFYKSLSKA